AAGPEAGMAGSAQSDGLTRRPAGADLSTGGCLFLHISTLRKQQPPAAGRSLTWTALHGRLRPRGQAERGASAKVPRGPVGLRCIGERANAPPTASQPPGSTRLGALSTVDETVASPALRRQPGAGLPGRRGFDRVGRPGPEAVEPGR